jgi:hypothetical protein
MKNKFEYWFKVFIRIIIFPFFGWIIAVSLLVLWFKYMINFVRFGGEAMAYTEKNQPVTIAEVYHELLEQRRSEYDADNGD